MNYPVLLPKIFDYPFTYKSTFDLAPGDYVEVPFGKSQIIGVVWDQFDQNNNKKFKYNVQSFSYPYGKYDYDCVNILKNYYNFAVTTNKSLFNKKKHGLLEMPRVSIGRNTSMFKFFLKTLTIYENLK